MPACCRGGAGMRRHLNESRAGLPRSGAAESFVSFIPLFDGAPRLLVVGRLSSVQPFDCQILTPPRWFQESQPLVTHWRSASRVRAPLQLRRRRKNTQVGLALLRLAWWNNLTHTPRPTLKPQAGQAQPELHGARTPQHIAADAHSSESRTWPLIAVRRFASSRPSNTGDKLRSGASRRGAAERTGRHLSLPYGCRPELRQLHPLVRRSGDPSAIVASLCVHGRTRGSHRGTASR